MGQLQHGKRVLPRRLNGPNRYSSLNLIEIDRLMARGNHFIPVPDGRDTRARPVTSRLKRSLWRINNVDISVTLLPIAFPGAWKECVWYGAKTRDPRPSNATYRQSASPVASRIPKGAASKYRP